MFPWFRGSDSSPRPPLAGRLVGLAVGVLSLSLAALLALDVVEAVIPVVLPLAGVLFIYTVLLGNRRRK